MANVSLFCSSNARVASTLAVPGVMDLLVHLGFEHAAEASTSSSIPTAFDPEAPSGVINLPSTYPGENTPLFHGALSLLRPLAADSGTGKLYLATLTALPNAINQRTIHGTSISFQREPSSKLLVFVLMAPIRHPYHTPTHT